jgi:hypothetical protein
MKEDKDIQSWILKLSTTPDESEGLKSNEEILVMSEEFRENLFLNKAIIADSHSSKKVPENEKESSESINDILKKFKLLKLSNDPLKYYDSDTESDSSNSDSDSDSSNEIQENKSKDDKESSESISDILKKFVLLNHSMKKYNDSDSSNSDSDSDLSNEIKENQSNDDKESSESLNTIYKKYRLHSFLNNPLSKYYDSNTDSDSDSSKKVQEKQSKNVSDLVDHVYSDFNLNEFRNDHLREYDDSSSSNEVQEKRCKNCCSII